MITLQKIIIHEIIKKANDKNVGKFYGKDIVPNSANAIKLIEKVNLAYEEDEIVYSTFDSSGDSLFPSLFDTYNNSTKVDPDFIDFSVNTLEELRKKLINVLPAKGGYYVYSEYVFREDIYIGIFLIRDTEGILFKKSKEGDGFEVDTITYMNTDKLAMACRINITKYRMAQGSYLTLIKKNQDAISDYFYEWISTANRESSKEYTDILYNIIGQLPLPIKAETTLAYTIDELRKDILSYINENKRNVNLRDIGEMFYNDKEALIAYASKHSISIDYEFKADKRSLSKFRHININSDGIKVQFSHGDYIKEKIRFSPENSNIVIIESAKFADALRREVSEYLQKDDQS